VRRLFSVCLAIVVTASMSGCFGTMIQSPAAAAGELSTTTTVRIIALPAQIDAHYCKHGLAETFTYVPLWGVVVGFLTIGIIVPMTTSYSCVPAPS